MDQAILLGKRKLYGASTRSLNWHGSGPVYLTLKAANLY